MCALACTCITSSYVSIEFLAFGLFKVYLIGFHGFHNFIDFISDNFGDSLRCKHVRMTNETRGERVTQREMHVKNQNDTNVVCNVINIVEAKSMIKKIMTTMKRRRKKIKPIGLEKCGVFI